MEYSIYWDLSPKEQEDLKKGYKMAYNEIFTMYSSRSYFARYVNEEVPLKNITEENEKKIKTQLIEMFICIHYTFLHKEIKHLINYHYIVIKMLKLLDVKDKLYPINCPKILYSKLNEYKKNLEFYCRKLGWPLNGNFPLQKAQKILARQWRIILARRQLERMKIRSELIWLPGIGLKYREAMDDFEKNNKKLIYSK